MTGSAHESRVGAGRPLVSWIVYDMAAHGYNLIVSGVGFPLYFAAFIAAGRGNADMLWSIALGLPLLAAGLLGPWIGAVADATGRRRALLAAMTVACGAATAMLVVVERRRGCARHRDVRHCAPHASARHESLQLVPAVDRGARPIRARLRARVGTLLPGKRGVLSAVPALHTRRSRARQRRHLRSGLPRDRRIPRR